MLSVYDVKSLLVLERPVTYLSVQWLCLGAKNGSEMAAKYILWHFGANWDGC